MAEQGSEWAGGGELWVALTFNHTKTTRQARPELAELCHVFVGKVSQ